MSTTPHQSADELERIERYLAADPANPHLLATAIDLCMAQGNLDAARKHADAAVALLPDDPFLAHRRGNVLIAQGELDAAMKVFASLLEHTPDPNIAFNLALTYFRLGHHAQARAVLEPYMAAQNATSAAVSLFVRTLHHLGDIAGAVEIIQSEMARCAGDKDFLAAASLVCLDDDQLEEAQRLSDAALASGERPLEALVVAGSIALARDDAGTAKTLFGEALSASPSDGRSWSGLGMASLLAGDLESAREQLIRATQNMPTHIGTLHALGWCQVIRGDIADAEQAFAKALALDRNFGESHGAMAIVHALQGRRKEAEESIARAKGLDAQGLSAQYAQMVLSGATSDPVKFRQLALRALSRRAGPFGINLAEAVAKRGR